MDLKYVGMGCLCVTCLVLVITALTSLNCAADKKWQCAQVSGFFAIVAACVVSSMVFLVSKHSSKVF